MHAEWQIDGMKKEGGGGRFGRRQKLTTEQVEEFQHRCQDRVLIKDLLQEYDLLKATVSRSPRWD